jgi:hypothetical protein
LFFLFDLCLPGIFKKRPDLENREFTIALKRAVSARGTWTLIVFLVSVITRSGIALLRFYKVHDPFTVITYPLTVMLCHPSKTA